ncbi:hypothetical protein [Candidatus Palauibacter sp.]|uniref:hypothetical protein n=1 Tax=Candidatus Palauibacter sp. TaxID=3101350 RepID=UPI003B520B4B
MLGCMTMGFLDVARTLSERLGVPVINPVFAALKAAESFAATGVRPSARAYPPPRKAIATAPV